jgi:hypothetical protein
VWYPLLAAQSYVYTGRFAEMQSCGGLALTIDHNNPRPMPAAEYARSKGWEEIANFLDLRAKINRRMKSRKGQQASAPHAGPPPATDRASAQVSRPSKRG